MELGVKREAYLEIILQYKTIYEECTGNLTVIHNRWRIGTKCHRILFILSIVSLLLCFGLLVGMLIFNLMKWGYGLLIFGILFIMWVLFTIVLVKLQKDIFNEYFRQSVEFRKNRLIAEMVKNNIFNKEDINLLSEFLAQNNFFAPLDKKIASFVMDRKLSSAFLGFLLISFINIYGKIISENIHIAYAAAFLVAVAFILIFTGAYSFIETEFGNELYKKTDLEKSFQQDLLEIIKQVSKN